MSTAIRAPLRLVRSTAEEIRDAELDLGLVERYFVRSAEIGPRLLTPEQMRNFATVIRRARLLFRATRRDA